jgi:hypothetical protein
MINLIKNMWLSGIGNKIFLICGALIAVGSIGGVVWVLIRVIRKMNDAGFATAPSGNDLYWKASDFPLNIFFDPIFPILYIENARTVMGQINNFIGKEVFGYASVWALEKEMKGVKDLPHATIYIGTDSPDEHMGGSNTYEYDLKTGEMDACYIKITSGFEDDVLLTVTRHELGHALGLDHDREIRASVMYPESSGRAKDFTEEDKKRLRSKYA